jgi:hypothetical protein
MVNWFCSLFCKHKWEYKHTIEINDSEFYAMGLGDVLIHRYDVYVCSKCLKTKKVHYC